MAFNGISVCVLTLINIHQGRVVQSRVKITDG